MTPSTVISLEGRWILPGRVAVDRLPFGLAAP